LGMRTVRRAKESDNRLVIKLDEATLKISHTMKVLYIRILKLTNIVDIS